ncbi:Piso0_004916 [Millerozyma farinosa CBS 7064]|uniref:Piso0_004916 protein n=1 Tax=Pichia sorbitophila (strain ATCC MYA-4447 / BCRC 22081 / CBS 7064 / NBRC 10061 / NRRL Y-12695) TaxID=559304 RepID=G8Y0S4_PICSO|nr:Piso0_004916 [Millerozyma farinosa CBS 7064]
MRVVAFCLLVVALVMSVWAAEDTSTTSVTTAWITLTSNGKLTTAPTAYSQSFHSVTTTESPSKGSIGLGTISGNIGGVRSYTEVTVSANNAAAFGRSLPGAPSVFGWGTKINVSLLLLTATFVALFL